jgi:isopenicillin N synthase-like dioxygenase
MGIGSHTDYECLTLLYSTAPGLEVLNSAGTWVDARPPAHSRSISAT